MESRLDLSGGTVTSKFIRHSVGEQGGGRLDVARRRAGTGAAYGPALQGGLT